ncbi:hypothetical protein AB0M19_16750 [Streptomyces sp. NPDC051920]
MNRDILVPGQVAFRLCPDVDPYDEYPYREIAERQRLPRLEASGAHAGA